MMGQHGMRKKAVAGETARAKAANAAERAMIVKI